MSVHVAINLPPFRLVQFGILDLDFNLRSTEVLTDVSIFLTKQLETHLCC